MTTGHNVAGAVAGDALRDYCERIERLTEERDELSADIREVKAEAKARGFDPKTLNEMLKLRKQDPHDRQEAEDLRRTYASALGLFD